MSETKQLTRNIPHWADPWNKNMMCGKDMSTKRITEVSGFIPLQERIETFILAGENLEDWRKENYPYADDDEVESKKQRRLHEMMNDYETDIMDILEEKKRVEEELKEVVKKENERAEKRRKYAEQLERNLEKLQGYEDDRELSEKTKEGNPLGGNDRQSGGQGSSEAKTGGSRV